MRSRSTEDMVRGNRWIRTLLCVGLAGAVLVGCGSDGNVGTEREEQLSEGVVAGDNTGADVGEEADTASDTGGTAEAAADKEADKAVDTGAEKDTEMTEVSDVGESQLKGVTLSILGDSLSTFEGWIPEGCAVFFPENGKLTDVSEMWWMQLLDETGMELCSNNSSSGSTCVGDSLFTGEVKYGCSTDRLSLLTGSQGKMPDIIIVYMGTNDLLTGVPIGDNDGTRLVEEGEIDNFSDAYTLILDKLSSEYPAAQVYCCGLQQTGDWGTTQLFVTFTNHLELTAEDYSKQIQIIAENKGMPYIDLYHCGIETDNLNEMTSDGVHFTPLGMEYVKEAVLSVLLDTVSR